MQGKQIRVRPVRVLLAALGLAMAAGAPAALALPAVVLTNVHLRAGPSVFYPSVMMVGAGSPAVVFGCELDFNWCDVQVGLNRGWIAAMYLQAQSPRGPVIVASNAALLGVPRVTFVLNNYWNTWYRGRPWFARRPVYYNYWRRFPHGRPPPPPPRPPVMRPPPRPPAVRPPPARPPANTRPPAGRPPAGTRPPPGSRPPGTSPPGPGNRQPGDRQPGGGPSPGSNP